MPQVAIAIGSNIDPEENIHACAELLRTQWPDVRFSSVYGTAAREVEEQDDFLNAVAVIETEQSPQEVLEQLRGIEEQLGKAPPFRFGPRTIDLDLLLYGQELINEEELTIPHARMHERRFVLEPLCEVIDPAEKHHLLGETWEKLLKETIDQECLQTSLTL